MLFLLRRLKALKALRDFSIPRWLYCSDKQSKWHTSPWKGIPSKISYLNKDTDHLEEYECFDSCITLSWIIWLHGSGILFIECEIVRSAFCRFNKCPYFCTKSWEIWWVLWASTLNTVWACPTIVSFINDKNCTGISSTFCLSSNFISIFFSFLDDTCACCHSRVLWIDFEGRTIFTSWVCPRCHYLHALKYVFGHFYASRSCIHPCDK